MSEQDPGYTVGEWGGRPNYRCARLNAAGRTCPWSSLDEETMRAHIRMAHGGGAREVESLLSETTPQLEPEAEPAEESSPLEEIVSPGRRQRRRGAQE